MEERLAPLVRFRVVEKQRKTFPMSLGTVRLDLLEECATVPHLARRHRPIQLDKVRLAGERIEHAPDVGMPDADIEIKIVLAVSWSVCLRRFRGSG